MSDPKLKLHIQRDKLAWFLDVLLDEREIFQLSTSTGIVLDVDRLHALSRRELLIQLANTVLDITAPPAVPNGENPEASVNTLVSEYLNEKAQTAISRVGYMEVSEIETFFKTSDFLIEGGDFGEIVWALLTDTRPSVVEHGYKLLNTTYEATDARYRNGNEPDQPPEETERPEEHPTLERDLQHLERQFANTKSNYTSLEKKHSRLEQQRAFLLEENRELKDRAAENRGTEKRVKVLEQENRILREQIAKYIDEASELQQLAEEREHLLVEKERMAERMREHEQIRAAKETFTTDLKLVEEAVYKGHQGLEDFQDHLDSHLDTLANYHQAARTALNQIRQTLTYLDTQQVPTGDRPYDPKTEQPRVGVFVDVQNMFYAAKDRFGGRVDYIKLLDLIVGPRYLKVAYAYVVQIPEINQSNFLSLLEHNGYTIKSKDLRLRGDGSAKGDWDVGIAVDVVSMLASLDVVILASGDGDFCPLAELIKQQDKRVEVVAFEHNTSMDLQQIADQFFPIGDELLIYGELYK